jgi:malic enzyme
MKNLKNIGLFNRTVRIVGRGNYTHSTAHSHYEKDITFTEKLGTDILNDPLLNDGTAFTYSDRDRLRLRGLIPPVVMSMDDQIQRLRLSFEQLPDNINKYLFCVNLQDRNETLFYKFLADNIKEIAPIIYTPTVGEACQKFSRLYRRPRGMYFSILQDKGHMRQMLYNWTADQVDVIVVTDGGRILGLGDLGANGMGIPIGKLSLYVAAGGIHPGRTLPVLLDVGTNNEELLNDKLYIGAKQKRLQGNEYFEFIDEFISAVRFRWPNVLIQFEDLTTQYAYSVLKKYNENQLCFNDDIQGTGAVTLAALLNALRSKGQSFTDLRSQRIVMVGGGTAGLGVAFNIRDGMCREGSSLKDANNNFWIVDVEGLIGNTRKNLKPGMETFARTDVPDGTSLLEVVKKVKPHILLGLSGTAGLFTEEVVKEMYKHEKRPIIFPLSNPTSKSECTASNAYNWTEGNAIFASGSPFDPVVVNGKTCLPTQCNNVFVYPGVGLGAVVGKCKKITPDMFYAATKTLAAYQTREKLEQGNLFPDVADIRHLSLQIAVAVIAMAQKEAVTQNTKLPRDLVELTTYVEKEMWKPQYNVIISADI